MAQDLTALLSSSSTVNAPKFENFYVFLHALANILKEPSIIFTVSEYEQNVNQKVAPAEFRVEVPPQKLRRITDALSEAEILNKKAEIVTNTDILHRLDQANKEISRRISRVLPTALLLALIEDYCEKRSTLLIQAGQNCRAGIHRTEMATIALFVIGTLCLCCNGLALLFTHQTALVFLALPGLLFEILGFIFLRNGSLQRRKLNEIIQKQDILNRFKMLSLLIKEITDQERKSITMENLLVSILTHDSKPPEMALD